jgi:hypothetical protein
MRRETDSSEDVDLVSIPCWRRCSRRKEHRPVVLWTVRRDDDARIRLAHLHADQELILDSLRQDCSAWRMLRDDPRKLRLLYAHERHKATYDDSDGFALRHGFASYGGGEVLRRTHRAACQGTFQPWPALSRSAATGEIASPAPQHSRQVAERLTPHLMSSSYR